jgi:hypothetical protein
VDLISTDPDRRALPWLGSCPDLWLARRRYAAVGGDPAVVDAVATGLVGAGVSTWSMLHGANR